MKIRKLQLKNIGVFDDEIIEFQPCPAKDKAEIHIFTGINGSGKSTILMALASVFEINESNDIHFNNNRKFNIQKRFRELNIEEKDKVSNQEVWRIIIDFNNGSTLVVYEKDNYLKQNAELRLSLSKDVKGVVTYELIKSITNENSQNKLRVSSVNALGELKAEQAIPIMKMMLNQPNLHNQIRDGIARAFASIRDKESIPLMRDILNDKRYSFQVRTDIAYSLAKMKAIEVIPELRHFAKIHNAKPLIYLVNKMNNPHFIMEEKKTVLKLWARAEIANLIAQPLRNYQKLLFAESQPKEKLDFAVFAYSGYRFVKTDKILPIKEYKENPLFDSLEFIKDYKDFTISQWIANTLSRRALADEASTKKNYSENLENLERIVSELTEHKVQFGIDLENLNITLKIDNNVLDFDVLPDGLKSLISWIGDLLMRLDSLKWKNDTPIFEREIILFLDEVEVHLHPEWQRKVLPVVQKLFKNSQIFVSTHSPFVVNSVDDAWVYELEVKDGKAKVREKNLTKTTESIQTTLEEVFEVPQIFGYEVQKDLDRFYELRSKIKNNGGDTDQEFKEIAKRLLKKSEEQNSVELQSIIAFELKQLKYEL